MKITHSRIQNPAFGLCRRLTGLPGRNDCLRFACSASSGFSPSVSAGHESGETGRVEGLTVRGGQAVGITGEQRGPVEQGVPPLPAWFAALLAFARQGERFGIGSVELGREV